MAPDYLLVHESVADQLVWELNKAFKKYFGNDILNNPEYPTILMGDLNVGWGTNVLPEFRNLGDHIGVSWVDHIFAFPKGRWTGHDFKSHSCPAANGKASLSDHDPITATLVLK